jgi:hypothetical protein
VTLGRYKGYDFAHDKPFSLADITLLTPVVKRPEFDCKEAAALESRARELDTKGKRKTWYTPGGPERAQATELLKEAISVCEFVYGREHPRTADMYFALAEQLESRYVVKGCRCWCRAADRSPSARHCELGRPEQSRWNRCAGVPADALSAEAEQLYRQAMRVREAAHGFYHEGVAQCLLGLARLQKNQPAEVTVDLLAKAVDITETLVGFNHPETGEMYRLMALVLQELNRARDASPWVRKAFVIFMAIFGKDHEMAKQLWRQLQSIELSIDSGLEQVPIEGLVARIEQLAFA